MSGYTKGQWKAEAYNSRMGSLISFGDISKGEIIGIVYAQKDPAEAQANARLIETAPNLLEVLKGLVSLAKYHMADAEDWHDYQHAVAAIAKAETL